MANKASVGVNKAASVILCYALHFIIYSFLRTLNPGNVCRQLSQSVSAINKPSPYVSIQCIPININVFYDVHLVAAVSHKY